LPRAITSACANTPHQRASWPTSGLAAGVARNTPGLAAGVRLDFPPATREHFGMLFESAHVRVTAEYGIGTLWLGFTGAPVNALDALRLSELDAALAALEPNPFLTALVVRSAKPAGFCAGLHTSVAAVVDRPAFAARGQRVLARLAALPFTTLALLDGPCLGAGLELALACDHRLCVATPATHLGFPDRFTCFGGGPRLRKLLGRCAGAFVESGRTLSGREARDLGLVDCAFCQRRAKIELRTFLDELERAPRVPARSRDETGFAAERCAFAAAAFPLPGAAGSVTPTDPAELLARGFITPLEAEQMSGRGPGAPAPPSEQAQPTSRRAA
jgi:enoyl-CoA hydratase/carnithine racemase